MTAGAAELVGERGTFPVQREGGHVGLTPAGLRTETRVGHPAARNHRAGSPAVPVLSVVPAAQDAPLLAAVPPSGWETFRFSRSQLVYDPTLDRPRLHLVLSGSVALSVARHGQRAAVDAVGPGGVFGDADDMGYETAAVTRARPGLYGAVVAVLDSRHWSDWCRERPEAGLSLLAALSRRAADADRRRALQPFQLAPARVACQLLRLALQFDDPASPVIRHGLSQGELGQVAGTSRETTARTLGAMVRAGLVELVRPGSFEIRDLARLRAAAAQRSVVHGSRGRGVRGV